MKVRLAAPAKADMIRIWAYYEKQRRGLGDDFLDDLTATIRQVSNFPHAQPEFWKGTRRILLNRFPYGAAYRVDGEDIVVVVIAHTSRADKVWRKRV